MNHFENVSNFEQISKVEKSKVELSLISNTVSTL
jgi:hypothetical protein